MLNNILINFLTILMLLTIKVELKLNNKFDQSDLVICVENGCLRGTTMPGYKTESFEAFLGIPFAEPPIGNLRFANPIPSKNWTGILDATVPKSDCIQKNYLLASPVVTGVEDCLYLNVYRPGNNMNQTKYSKDKLLPVMVYIFGGAFFSGSIHPGISGPEYFMDNGDVILVLMNYRLGAMGFLSTGDKYSPGNYGLKDQTMALKWIQKNIHKFGGDRYSVTIFGQSAGAVSVHFHMMSSLSKNLFHRAIMISGNAIAPFADPTENPIQLARKQAKLLNITNSQILTTKRLIDELRRIDAHSIVDSGDKLRYWSVDPLTLYRPVIEQDDNEDAFLVQHPRILSKRGNFTKVPVMTGFLENEGAIRALGILSNSQLVSEFNSRFTELLINLLEYRNMSEIRQIKSIKKISHFYLNGRNYINNETEQGLINIITDRGFLHPFYHFVKDFIRATDTGEIPLYLYKFTYSGPISYALLLNSKTNSGVSHCDDLLYLFRSPFLFGGFPNNLTHLEKSIQLMVDNYVSFAKYGQPTSWRDVRACNENYSSEICDYIHFRNSPVDNNQLETILDNKFNLTMIRLWDDILTP